jgi:hypothetical protein
MLLGCGEALGGWLWHKVLGAGVERRGHRLWLVLVEHRLWLWLLAVSSLVVVGVGATTSVVARSLVIVEGLGLVAVARSISSLAIRVLTITLVASIPLIVVIAVVASLMTALVAAIATLVASVAAIAGVHLWLCLEALIGVDEPSVVLLHGWLHARGWLKVCERVEVWSR